MNDDRFIYKIMHQKEWAQARDLGVYHGAPVDEEDGFIHFSTRKQVAETASKHFAGCNDLLLVAVRTGPVEAALRWEVSRGGALFPHLYSPLSLAAVEWAKPMPLIDGVHQLPLPTENET